MINIYSALGFHHLGTIVYPNTLIEKARKLFDAFPARNKAIRPIVVEQMVLEESFAISSAEDSDLTLQDSKKIVILPEIEARLIKYRENRNLSSKQKYDQLEFENVKTVEEKIGGITFNDLTTETLRNLHYELTVGLDEYCKDAGVSRYHSGKFRSSDDTRVGKIRTYSPPSHAQIPHLLDLLIAELRRRKKIHLVDILEFHILLYAIHPFSNGNKRVTRVLESMLLRQYGYSADRTLSLAMYYGLKKSSTSLFLMESLHLKDPTPFVNFAIRGYFYSGRALENEMAKAHLRSYLRTMIDLLSGFFSKEKLAPHRIAADVIFELNGIFTHGQFIEHMGKKGYTLGVSQELLKYLKKENYLSHKNSLYCAPGAYVFSKHRERLLKFYLQNQIVFED